MSTSFWRCRVLLVEDNPADVRLIGTCLFAGRGWRGWMRRTSLLLVVGLVIVCAPSAATILTFDGLGLPQFGEITNYGSNMTAACTGSGQAGCVDIGNGLTPNISVTYRTVAALGAGGTTDAHTGFWDTSAGDLLNVTYPAQDLHFAEITLTPEAGWAVRLNSFDIAGWPTEDYADQSIRVYNSDYSVNLFSFTGTIHGAGPTHDTFGDLNLVSNGAVHIQFGPSWNIDMDNVSFDQTAIPGSNVPEPSSIILAALGSLAVGAGAWRRLS